APARRPHCRPAGARHFAPPAVADRPRPGPTPTEHSLYRTPTGQARRLTSMETELRGHATQLALLSQSLNSRPAGAKAAAPGRAR
ncbi:hypothetical protein ACWC5I_18165, partial [Kitasatospora sp. NPDC001574]